MTPRVIVLMGVSGSGKSTVGEALAKRIGCPYQEGDDLHPPANIAKMSAGLPLDDADRLPWLQAVGRWIAERGNGWGVVSCSALKRDYRDLLRATGRSSLAFVLLDTDEATLRDRLLHRHHFMPVSLLDSQLATLERPGPDEQALILREQETIAADCEAICAWLATLA